MSTKQWSKPEYEAAFCQGYAHFFDCENPQTDSPFMVSPYPKFTKRQKAYVMGWRTAQKEEK